MSLEDKAPTRAFIRKALLDGVFDDSRRYGAGRAMVPMPTVLVRVNSLDHAEEAAKDMMALAIQGVAAFVLPKVESVHHIQRFEEMAAAAEAAASLPLGTIPFLPLVCTLPLAEHSA